MYTIQLTKRFMKDIRKLSVRDQELVLDKLAIMEANPRYQSKKMEGRLGLGRRETFRTRVNDDIRLLWQYGESGRMIIIMLRVGHHDVLRDY